MMMAFPAASDARNSALGAGTPITPDSAARGLSFACADRRAMLQTGPGGERKDEAMGQPSRSLDRRRMLGGSVALGGLGLGGLTGLSGCATGRGPAPLGAYAGPAPLAPVRATPDRLFDITLCLRPFRAAGPRPDTATIGATLV